MLKFIGKNVRHVVEREDEKYCFRLHKNRVYYVREALVKKATNVRFHRILTYMRGGDMEVLRYPMSAFFIHGRFMTARFAQQLATMRMGTG